MTNLAPEKAPSGKPENFTHVLQSAALLTRVDTTYNTALQETIRTQASSQNSAMLLRGYTVQSDPNLALPLTIEAYKLLPPSDRALLTETGALGIFPTAVIALLADGRPTKTPTQWRINSLRRDRVAQPGVPYEQLIMGAILDTQSEEGDEKIHIVFDNLQRVAQFYGRGQLMMIDKDNPQAPIADDAVLLACPISVNRKRTPQTMKDIIEKTQEFLLEYNEKKDASAPVLTINRASLENAVDGLIWVAANPDYITAAELRARDTLLERVQRLGDNWLRQLFLSLNQYMPETKIDNPESTEQGAENTEESSTALAVKKSIEERVGITLLNIKPSKPPKTWKEFYEQTSGCTIMVTKPNTGKDQAERPFKVRPMTLYQYINQPGLDGRPPNIFNVIATLDVVLSATSAIDNAIMQGQQWLIRQKIDRQAESLLFQAETVSAEQNLAFEQERAIMQAQLELDDAAIEGVWLALEKELPALTEGAMNESQKKMAGVLMLMRGIQQAGINQEYAALVDSIMRKLTTSITNPDTEMKLTRPEVIYIQKQAPDWLKEQAASLVAS